AAALAGGSCQKTLTELVAVVHSDIPTEQMPAAKVIVSHSSDPSAPTVFETDCTCVGDGPGCTLLPLSLGIVPGRAGVGRFTVRARGYSDRDCKVQLVEQS